MTYIQVIVSRKNTKDENSKKEKSVNKKTSEKKRTVTEQQRKKLKETVKKRGTIHWQILLNSA